MAKTTRKMIQDWFDEGIEQKYNWMVIVCDTYDHEDYPEYAKTRSDAEAIVAKPGKMARVMEVYDLTADRGPQLSAQRVWALNANDPAVVRKGPRSSIVDKNGAYQGVTRRLREDALVRQLADKLSGNPSPSGPDIVDLSQRLVAVEQRLAVLYPSQPFSRLTEAERRIAKLEKKLKKLAD